MPGFDILSIIGDEWNDAGSLFGGIKVTVTDTASYPTSRFLEFVLNGTPIYRVLKTGETVVSNAAGTSIGGFGMRGNAGEMALTSQIHPSTGRPADVVRWYWENGLVGNSAVIRGMGTNRLSLESSGVITQISNNSRFEFEGYISPRVIFAGFQAASAIGKPFDFNNYGQTPSRANPVVSISVASASDDALHICSFSGSAWTTLAKFNGQGILFAPLFNTQRGMSCTIPGETTSRLYAGLDGSLQPFIAMGPGGTASFDVRLHRVGPGMLGFGGVTAGFPALKRAANMLRIRLADDSDYAAVQGKLTTHGNAVAETITPNSTLTLYDAAGVAYKVPCVAA